VHTVPSNDAGWIDNGCSGGARSQARPAPPRVPASVAPTVVGVSRFRRTGCLPAWVRVAALLATAIGASSVALALDPGKNIDQYAHDTWTPQSGLPGEAVYQILQSRDGYLWLRTSAGLVRFDGVRFVTVSPRVGGKTVEEPKTAERQDPKTFKLAYTPDPARKLPVRNGTVKTGIDVLEETRFAALHPARGGAPRSIGLLTNQTGVDAEGRRTAGWSARPSGVPSCPCLHRLRQPRNLCRPPSAQADRCSRSSRRPVAHRACPMRR